jgi:hypothetical protein
MFSLQLLPPVILFEIALLLNLADLPRLTSLVRYVELPQPTGIQTTKDKMFAIGAGSITFAAIGEKSKINLFQLNNVFHIPGMDANLFPINDNKTPMTAIVGLQSKTAAELLSVFKVYQNLVEKKTGRRVKRFGSNRGGEFQKEFGKHLRTQKIIHKVTA